MKVQGDKYSLYYLKRLGAGFILLLMMNVFFADVFHTHAPAEWKSAKHAYGEKQIKASVPDCKICHWHKHRSTSILSADIDASFFKPEYRSIVYSNILLQPDTGTGPVSGNKGPPQVIG